VLEMSAMRYMYSMPPLDAESPDRYLGYCDLEMHALPKCLATLTKMSQVIVWLVILALTLLCASQAQAVESAGAWYAQAGVAEDAESLTVGVSRDWRWEKQYRYGHISGQWQGELGRWHSDTETSTQLGLTPAMRWRPNGWREGWFIEGGIGLNVIFPKYSTQTKRFSTTFNFGDHIALGKRFGADGNHEWSLRAQHFSNARIESPNPGENFFQVRYTYRR